MKTTKIRPIAIALIKNKDKYLVIKGFDRVKKQLFYRPLGGGIEFGETGEMALKREMKEELNAAIAKVKFLNFFENIFIYNGVKMHEIVFVYSAVFTNKKYYQKTELPIIDSHSQDAGFWVSTQELKKGRLYPNGIKKLIS